MTVNTENITSGPYVGNNIADTFSYTFRISDKTELKVWVTDTNGITNELTVDTDYTVAGIGVDAGGTITLTAGPLATDYVLYMRSNYDDTQLTAFGSQGAFFPEIHEDAMDKLTFMVQQLRDLIARSPRFDESYSGALDLLLDPPSAGDFLRWKSDLSGVESVSLSTNPGTGDAVTTSYDDTTAAFEWGVTDVQAALDHIKAGPYMAQPSTSWLRFSTDNGATFNGGILDVGAALVISYGDSDITFSNNRILIQADASGAKGQVDCGYFSTTGPTLTSGDQTITWTVDNDGVRVLGIPSGASRPAGLTVGNLWLDTSGSASDPTLKVVLTP